MKITVESSLEHLELIAKEINIIKNCMDTFNIRNEDLLESSEFAQRICTQCIINIEANKKLLHGDVVANIPKFNAIILKKTRDISSHDYNSVDMQILYKLCSRLIVKNILTELNAEIKRITELEG